MLRLIIKLILSPFAIITGILGMFVGFMLWDERAFKDCGRLLEIIWSDNEGIDFDI